MTGYQAFNMKDVLQAIREKRKEEIENIELEKEETVEEYELKTKKKFFSYINDIPDNITVEELPIYRDYLSKFTLSPFFRDKPLLTLFDDTLSKADGDLLIKLICGSFACTYLIDYNEEKGGLELTLHVETKEESRTGKLEELWPFQIVRFFEIYLDEQLYFEYLLKKECYNNIDDLKEEMGVRVVVFEQKMRALEDNYRQRKNDNEDIDAELDELLRS